MFEASLPRRLARSCLVVTLAAAIGCAQAASVRYYAAGEVPSPAVVAAVLGKAGAAPRMKMRGGAAADEPAAQRAMPLSGDAGRNIDDDPAAREATLSASAHSAVKAWEARHGTPAAGPAAAATAAKTAAAAERPTALALAIAFDNDSARLQAASLPSLDAVAAGLHQAGASTRVLIEGHTSASGSWEHNLRLSRARAESVKRYLVSHHGIAAAALRTVGLGPTAPLNANDPNAAVNRRVQFRGA